ncbi:MAG: DUF2892 domain-containing protein [candidate division Zixibacteria bacterium]|nr:DUF2892 domain-containing protein [candidate division Zixibacteria bacterium]
MKPNVGATDRIIRLILGVIIIVVGVIFNSWWGLVGVVIFLTGLLGRCGLYLPFGINTCKVKPQEPVETTKEEQA